MGWFLVLVCGVLSYLAVLRVLLVTRNPNFFPTLLFIGSVTVPLATMLFASSGRRGPLAPGSVLALVAVAGGVVGTLAAGLLEYEALRQLSFLPMILVGLIEETAKLAVPAVVLLFSRRAMSWAGVAVGVASATGFATLETMGYGFVTLIASAGDIAAVDSTLLLRGLLSPACHIAWTGLTVSAMWRLPARGSSIRWFVVAFALAVVLHAAWDQSTSVPVHTVIAVLSSGVLLGVIAGARRRGPGRLSDAVLGSAG